MMERSYLPLNFHIIASFVNWVHGKMNGERKLFFLLKFRVLLIEDKIWDTN